MSKNNYYFTQVGIDLVHTERINALVKKYPVRFPEKILGESELAQYAKRPQKIQYLAGRFAAKEAIIKSLRGRLTKRPPYNELQILTGSDGAPVTEFSPTLSHRLAATTCSVSISHDGAYACAVAICHPRTKENQHS